MKKNISLLIVAFVLILFYSCENERVIDVDVEEIEVQIEPVKIDRLEVDIFNLNAGKLEIEKEKLQNKYGAFFNTYLKGILNNGGVKDSASMNMINRFIHDKDMRDAYNQFMKSYPDVHFLEEEMTRVFKLYKYHFPNASLPRVITMMSGFNYGSIYSDSVLAIGLEMYLGSKSEFYPMLNLPAYRTLFMNKENITVDAFRTWMFTIYPYNMNKTDFLSDMIFLGKILYLNDAMLPEVNDTAKIQYTQKQLEYSTQNEYNLWTYFVAQKLLYTTNHVEIMKYTGEGPFTSAISKECPPRIAYWLGWQIVRQYMQNNPDVTLEQLMKQDDAQVILSQSKYKPKK